LGVPNQTPLSFIFLAIGKENKEIDIKNA